MRQRSERQRHPGSKVVGCYPVYTLVEVIHPAGMLPVGILGGGNRLEIAHANSRFQSFICSISRAALNASFWKGGKFVALSVD